MAKKSATTGTATNEECLLFLRLVLSGKTVQKETEQYR
jgi:hypothetical protein